MRRQNIPSLFLTLVKANVFHHGISIKVFTENKIYCVEKVSFCSYFCIFSKKIMNWVVNFGNWFFCIYSDNVGLSVILWIIQIVLWMWKQLFIPEINLTWTSCIIFLYVAGFYFEYPVRILLLCSCERVWVCFQFCFVFLQCLSSFDIK